MLKVKKSKVYKDYQLLCYSANKLYNKGKFNESLLCAKRAAQIAYHLNFRFCDMRLEKLCNDVGTSLLSRGGTTKNREKNGRVIFYDCFGYDSRGLTQQYIRALQANGIPFTYVLNSKIPLEQNPNIQKELNDNQQATVVELDKNLSDVDKLLELYSIVKKINPAKVFLHMAPNDVVGVAVWSFCNDSIRYQINLTDHAFWLGAGCIDYNIEFREYGRSLTLQERNLREDQLLYLPYYPLRTAKIPFEGFPFEKKANEIVLFSGASLYKFYGDKNKYFLLMKQILDTHLNTKLIIAGSGEIAPFKAFINNNGYQDRVIMLGDRRDISAIFDNVDIYIGSYPMCGGLMSQFAVEAGVPIVQYTSARLPINIIETLFPFRPAGTKVTYFDDREFLNQVDMLISSKEKRSENVEKLRNSVISPERFNAMFKSIYKLDDDAFFCNGIEEYDISVDTIFRTYLELENEYLKQYWGFWDSGVIKAVLGSSFIGGSLQVINKVQHVIRSKFSK